VSVRVEERRGEERARERDRMERKLTANKIGISGWQQ
jgi:hypothetical protein